MAKIETRRSGRGTIAAASLRRSGIDDMHWKGTISDALKSAADRFQRWWTTAVAEPPGLEAINYVRPKVGGGKLDWDGGMVAWVQARNAAQDKLAALRREMGDEHFRVLKVAAGEGGSLCDVAQALGCAKSTASAKITRALERMCLH